MRHKTGTMTTNKLEVKFWNNGQPVEYDPQGIIAAPSSVAQQFLPPVTLGSMQASSGRLGKKR